MMNSIRQPSRYLARLLTGLGRVVRAFIARAYAAAILVVICYVCWRAVQFLLLSLVDSPTTPRQITALPARMDPKLLTTQRADWEALNAVPHARSPLAHYHRLDNWLQPDPRNNCTVTCHAPLPHSRNKETRAFLNMHSTSLHCGVCHMKSPTEPPHFGWYDLVTGEPAESPAILQALSELTRLSATDAAPSPDLSARKRVKTLMRRAAEQSAGNPGLAELAEHFAALRTEGPAFASLAESALAALPRHFRGEYGHKIALINPATKSPMLAHPNTGSAVTRFLNNRNSATDEQLTAMLAAVHPLRREHPAQCTDCHQVGVGLLDWSALGYPPQRTNELTQSMLMQMIQRISAGQEFHLPTFVFPAEPGGPKPP